MTIRRFASLAILPFLSACQAEAEPLTGEDILSRSQLLTRPAPGLYRTTTTLADFALPNASQWEAERMRRRFGMLEPQSAEACLAIGDSGFTSVIDAVREGDCAFLSFEADAERLDARMHCELPDGTTSDLTMLGEAGRESSRLETRVVQHGQGIPGGELSFSLVVETQRMGACPGPLPAPATDPAPETLDG